METEKKKIIGNVGMLDIRTATEESIDRIAKIGNAGSILCSPETKGFITKLQIGNAGSVIVVPDDARILTGQETLGKDAFSDYGSPVSLVVAGQVVFSPEIPEDDIRNGIDQINASGQLFVPKKLAGLIQSKVVEMSGQLIEYEGEEPHILMGRTAFTQAALEGLEDAAELMILGRVNFPDVLPNELIERKLGKLTVVGRIKLREENQAAISRALTGVHAKMTVIPSGVTVVEHEATIDSDTLAALPGRSLYLESRVTIMPDVEPDAFDQAIDRIVPKASIVCPDHLKSVLAKKCDVLSHRPIYTVGEVLRVEDELHLSSMRFDFMEEPVTLVVTGELYLDAAIDPKTLHGTVIRLHNMGEVHGTPDQISALQARTVTDKGEFVDSTQVDAADEKSNKDDRFERIGNVGTLRI